MKSYRTPLSKAHGLGSAKEGVTHWWMQRLTAIALVPLLLWLSFAIAGLSRADYTAVHQWLEKPLNAILLLVTCGVMYYHSALGLQVVIEDYIQSKWLKFATLIGVNFLNFFLAVVSVFFILKIAFGR